MVVIRIFDLMIVMMVIFMIMMNKLPTNHTYIMTFHPKCTNFRDFFLGEKRAKIFGLG